jgi:hypothetical protein
MCDRSGLAKKFRNYSGNFEAIVVPKFVRKRYEKYENISLQN